MWRIGDRLHHRMNRELGVGRVVALDGRYIQVEFVRAGTTLTLAADAPVLAPVTFGPGRRVRVENEVTRIAEALPNGRFLLEDGREAGAEALWPLDLDETLIDRLARGDLDPLPDFQNRIDAYGLLALREANDLRSFLGGRIRLFPHQLHVASLATAQDPVRWLLADEVGLGKTVEACLILNHLVHTGRVRRCLVVAPATLTVQWLGELWRKYHRVFVLLDDKRLEDVSKDFGPKANPFEIHDHCIVSLEALVAHRRLTEQAVEAGIDLLVVDEAHHLRRPPGHPGDAAYRAVAPIAALGRHVLLLSATPFEDDAHGFVRLLQLLRPDHLPEGEFEARLAGPLPTCASSTRREDIGGLPPRVGRPVDISPTDDRARCRLEEALLAAAAKDALARRKRADRLRRAASSGAALAAVLAPSETALSALCSMQDRSDPRIAHLAREATQWKKLGHKTLIFVAQDETLEMVRESLGRLTGLATAVFHERLSPARRDIEVARFRDPDGPSLLVSTECGGEGRNFEFCHRIVLFDLPWAPAVVEQRIGRLDRIGRRMDVEIVYFRPPQGLAGEVVRLVESTRVFEEPIAGLERDLVGIEGLIEKAASGGTADPGAILEAADEARSRIRSAARSELLRGRYQAEMAAAILALVPSDLDSRTEGVIVTAAERLSLLVERGRGPRVFSFEFGSTATVDSLPGIPGDASFLGTFDREVAVAYEALDFFAFGHPLVEGLLADLEESARGRVSLLRLRHPDGPALGLLAAYRTSGGLELRVVDGNGRQRSDWRDALSSRPFESGAHAIARAEGFDALVRRLAPALGSDVPAALAAVVVERDA